MSTNLKRDIAVIGTGYWGKNLVRVYHELGRLHTICDTNSQTLREFKTRYPDIETTDDFQHLLANPDIKGIVISTPAETHYRFAEKALNSEKHTYVEKPLALQLEEAEELVELAKEKNRILMVGHIMQYHPAFVRLLELVRAGDLGKIHYIYSNRLSLGKIRQEENTLWSFAPHDISMILSLCQDEPVSVHAIGGNFLQDTIADVTVTHLVFSSGIQSHIFVSWLHPFKEQKLVVVGTGKMAVFSDTESWENKLLLYPHTIRFENGEPIPEKADAVPVDVKESEPLENECEHFLGCIDENRRPLTDGEEGVRVLRVLRQAQVHLE